MGSLRWVMVQGGGGTRVSLRPEGLRALGWVIVADGSRSQGPPCERRPCSGGPIRLDAFAPTSAWTVLSVNGAREIGRT